MITAFCKRCHKVIEIEKPKASGLEMCKECRLEFFSGAA